MLPLIMNQYKNVEEEIINSDKFPNKISPDSVITLLTKYYYMQQEYSRNEIIDLIISKMNSYNLSIIIYEQYKAEYRINKVYDALEKGNTRLLKICDKVLLYKSEYEKIISCENDRERKMLFTLYILARYTDAYGWIYYPETDIVKLSNTTSTKKTGNLISVLLRKGLIKTTKKVDDLKIGVELSDGNEPIELEVTTLSNLGNQFICHYKPGWRMCICCNKLIKIKSKTKPQKYCKPCAEKINSEKTNENQKEKRKSLII